MAATGNLVINGNVNNISGGASITIGPTTITSATAFPLAETLSLTGGTPLTLTIAAGTTCLVIVGPNGANPAPNPTFGGTLTLKGASGDTGVAISARYPTVLEWDTAPASIVLLASVTTTVAVWGF